VATHEEADLKTWSHHHIVAHIYKIVILSLIITKMPLWTENDGLVTWTGSLTWCRCGNDVEITWQISLDLMISIQAPKFCFTKYLKIFRDKD